MQKIELSVHEFMTIMGTMDETYGGRMKAPDESVYAHWYTMVLDERQKAWGSWREPMAVRRQSCHQRTLEAHFRSS